MAGRVERGGRSAEDADDELDVVEAGSGAGVGGAIAMAVAAAMIQPVYESGAVLRVTSRSVVEFAKRVDELRTDVWNRKAWRGSSLPEGFIPGRRRRTGLTGCSGTFGSLWFPRVTDIPMWS